MLLYFFNPVNSLADVVAREQPDKIKEISGKGHRATREKQDSWSPILS